MATQGDDSAQEIELGIIKTLENFGEDRDYGIMSHRKLPVNPGDDHIDSVHSWD